MIGDLRARELRIYRLAIPLRARFEHAAAVRDTTDPVIVSVSAGAPHAHHIGHGETLARTYVTGETVESVIDDITHIFAPRLTGFRANSFAAALEFLEALPMQISGRVITAARAAVELALLDLACRVFGRRPADAAGWLGLPGFGRPGCLTQARYTGVITGRTPWRQRAFLRLQRFYGLRDFKLKVAVDGWEERLRRVHRVLARPIDENRVTLRVDANGAWSLAEAHDALALLENCGVCALEQPLSESHDDDLPYLAEQTRCDLIVDESLLTLEDAQRLIAAGGVRVLNIRIAKNGGLLPALRMARLALTAGLDVQLGCLVGETSLLAAAGVAFLEACPKARFVEGAYAPYLLHQDITRRPVRFRRGGRMSPRPGPGLDVNVDPARLQSLSIAPPRSIAY